MNLLSVSGLTKSFGERVLFSGISFGIASGDKVALVADNGSGKSTLFRILKGTETADEGDVVFRRELRVAFLEQDFTLSPEMTVEQAVHSDDNVFVRALKEYELAVSAGNDPKRMDDALQQVNMLGAWDYEKNIAEILSRLGINDRSRPIRTFSGGQKKRIALALALISKPELLVLDEPTNHLDIDMIEWLEDYLSDPNLSLLLVTHDRYFLDNVCDRILELDGGALFEYRGGFSGFMEQKAERVAAFEAETDKARNIYRRELEWMRRMPKARGTKARARVNAFADIESRAKKRRQQGRIALDVKMERLGSKIVELHKVSKAFDGNKLVSNFTYTFVGGETVGIVGKNGSGKTTLLRIIQGLEPPDTGKVQHGDTVVFGYYSQSGIQLKDDKRIIDVVKDIAEYIPMSGGTSLSASQLLTRFNFQPARQYTLVSKLSGGEKRRLYLLTVLARNPNFLVLDEPSNDLDLLTLQTLEEFLDGFKGCVLIASHDRFLLDRLADHTFAMEGDGVIKDYPGGYSEYRDWKEAEREAEKGAARAPVAKAIEPDTAEIKASATRGKLSFKLQRELEEIERTLPQLEERKLLLTEQLSSGLSDYEQIRKISEELSRIEADLDAKMNRWLEIQEET
jgi:ABC transport system ATP-binding/permease protein